MRWAVAIEAVLLLLSMKLPLLFLPLLLATSWLASAEPALPEVKLPAQAREAMAEEVLKLIQERPGVSVLDVRTAEEGTAEGRLPGSRHLDYFRDDFVTEALKIGLDPAKPCVVYCALGGRSKRAATLLAKAGFKEILILKDGFDAWKKAGKPVEGGKQVK